MAAKKKNLQTLHLKHPKVDLGPRVYRIKLQRVPKLWIKVTILKSGVGMVDSNLRNEFVGDDDSPRMRLDRAAWNMQMDAIESLLLALGCAGVDLDSPEFIQGVNTALDAIANDAS